MEKFSGDVNPIELEVRIVAKASSDCCGREFLAYILFNLLVQKPF